MCFSQPLVPKFLQAVKQHKLLFAEVSREAGFGPGHQGMRPQVELQRQQQLQWQVCPHLNLRPFRRRHWSTRCQQASPQCHMLQHGHSHYTIKTYKDASGALMQTATFTAQKPAKEPLSEQTRGSGQGQGQAPSRLQQAGQAEILEFPRRTAGSEEPHQDPPMVRVRLSVHYRVHSRQMLCIGGSQIPFGWSFLSIAKVPMAWNQGDIWTAEVEMPVNTKMDYKYVILEEQDWTKQEHEDAEGVVTFSYRTEPESPPDVQTIQKQMAIVAWQPGPNRVVSVPTQEEIQSLKQGQVRAREPAKPQQQTYSAFRFGASQLGPSRLVGSVREISTEEQASWDEELKGTTESISLDVNRQCLVERRDVWGRESPSHPGRGLRFG